MNTPTIRLRCGRLACACALLAGVAVAADVAQDSAGRVTIGATPAEVIAALGRPQGWVVRGPVTVYYYDRGLVEFRDGRVSNSDLVSPEEAARLAAERERILEVRRRQAEAERRRLTVEGQQVLQAQVADAAFGARPAAERLAYWQSFARKYPYTDVSNRLAVAAAEAEAAQQRKDAQASLEGFRQRVAAIDARFRQLDADYAASLANWKRNEIDAERVRLAAQRDQVQRHILQLEAQLGTNAPPAAAAPAGP